MDYNELWALTGSISNLRVLMVYAAERDLDITQGDVDTAFLNREFRETIYMSQPPGFEDGTQQVWRSTGSSKVPGLGTFNLRISSNPWDTQHSKLTLLCLCMRTRGSRASSLVQRRTCSE
jgi:hypothetical protein